MRNLLRFVCVGVLLFSVSGCGSAAAIVLYALLQSGKSRITHPARPPGVPVVMVAQMGGVQSAWVSVEYTLVDSDSTAVSIVVKYSADGIDFHDATEAVSDPDTGKVSSGTNNLAASAAGVTLALSGALLQMSESECSTQHILR